MTESNSSIRQVSSPQSEWTCVDDLLRGITAPRIGLNELPQWCAYTARMLAGEALTPANRNVSAILRTYELHYARCLEYIDQLGVQASMEDVRAFQNRVTADVGRHNSKRASVTKNKPICVSLGDLLFELDDDKEQEINLRIMIDALSNLANECKTIVELGAGYGYGLHRLEPHFHGKNFCGADFSANAVAIAKRVFAGQTNVTFHQFCLTDVESYKFLEYLEPPLLVFTRHAVEQVQESEPVLQALTKHKENIHAVVHFEPLYQPADSTALGILRRRYMEHQAYNTDLLPQLEANPGIELIKQQINTIGRNPLLPLSTIAWRFA